MLGFNALPIGMSFALGAVCPIVTTFDATYPRCIHVTEQTVAFEPPDAWTVPANAWQREEPRSDRFALPEASRIVVALSLAAWLVIGLGVRLILG